MIIIKVC